MKNQLIRFRQVVNRNIDKKYNIQQIVNALKGKDFISKTKEEQLIISRFFLEGTEGDLIEATTIPGITKTSLKSLYLTSPFCKNPADTTWDKRFRVTPKKALTSINPSSNKALQHLLNKKDHTKDIS
ncbi:hypothetical protein [Sulfuricurvum sp.]|uniref:hypothetical protein n=1 Tax=Sulfuricurvum sp. TaxID=2025608 RepID=UPI00262AB852|nr:hypothetical protein [Sulfuricurvum sp.]MDD3596988.1 hypothetical protein [Sulfuricurvum sp.]